jgi:hypothetical protein
MFLYHRNPSVKTLGYDHGKPTIELNQTLFSIYQQFYEKRAIVRRDRSHLVERRTGLVPSFDL